jgi:hypothetical protein
VAERIKRVIQSIPGELKVVGRGSIVSLVQEGAPGEREIFRGTSSNKQAALFMAKVRTETKPGAIILMHDGGANRLQTVAAIPKVVDWLFAHGYSITTLEHILG